MTTAAEPLLSVRGLSKTFHAQGASIRAVHEVSFELQRGRTLALVGESGCGKSTTGRLVLRLIEPSAGQVRLSGSDIASAKGRTLNELRRKAQIVFQDPMGSLNPRMTVGAAIGEPLLVHGVKTSERHERVAQLLREVELGSEYAARYPMNCPVASVSVAIARAWRCVPK